MAKTAITPTRSVNYADWYQEVIKVAELAEHSPVRGCMVIKPWGYGIWENMKKILDSYFKKENVENAYFPLFIPLSFLEKEAEHVEGFAKECAVVTHHRLEKKDNKLLPAKEAELTEPLIIRPTSEMIIGEMFSKWIESYRDLPLKINQWANVVRWEMRTRMFLRTAEFLWQEGHTAHATEDEALQMTMKMLDVYANFAEEYLAIPTIKGYKTETEKFPGAVTTYCFEALMQDKKALQMGTSHFLGQNFSKSCNIKFRDQNLVDQYAWTTSWGVATRLIGALVMTHSDDDGLVLPPKIAPKHVVILPIIHKEDNGILKYCSRLKEELQSLVYANNPIQIELDDRDMRGGEKKWSWVKKGMPIRIEVGNKEIENKTVTLFRRDKSPSEKVVVPLNEIKDKVLEILEDIQKNLLKKAKRFLQENIVTINSKEQFYEFFKNNNGACLSAFIEDEIIEQQIQKDLNVTVRCVPLKQEKGSYKCIFSNKPTNKKMLFAKAY